VALKVIGAGLGRTGTASIKVALEQLGMGRCYHMGEVLAKPADTDRWLSAADGEPDWDALFNEYGAAVDYPTCSFWQELADFYPDAKVLLSVRDANSWFESTKETIFSPELREWSKASPIGHFLRRTVWADFENRFHDRDFMVSYFERRIDHIKSALPPERLLVYEVKEGWAPLCDFLQVEDPVEPFPRVNSREETAKMIDAIIGGSAERPLDEVLKEHSQDMFDNESGRSK
jgi:hypothetical protein